MERSDLKNKIQNITGDETKTINQRIDSVIELRDATGTEDESEALRNDIIFYTSLIDMIQGDKSKWDHAYELLLIYGLLAEVYVKKEEYRPLKHIAREVNSLLQYDGLTWKMINQAVPAILDALGETVFNHALYEMLVLYLSAAQKAGKLGADLKGRARRMLKLKLNLKDDSWCNYLIDDDMQKRLARIISSEEYLHIILNPRIGRLKKDPVEYTEEWEDIYYDVEDRLAERFANAPRQRGFCRLLWRAKKELLKEEYDIDWASPAQMNPRIKFD